MVVAALAVGTLALATPSAQAAQPPRPDPRATVTAARPQPLLDAPTHGPEAIRDLGDDLPTAAERSDLSPAELRSLLRQDHTAWVDRQGAVAFIDPGADTAGRRAARATPQPAISLADTFRLHSDPSANLTILLDFDGANVSGTAWNSSYGVTPSAQPAWDPAGNGPDFTDTEKLMVQQVWAMVAEDYVPFDVDVTTEDEGADQMVRTSDADPTCGTRVLITPSDDAFAKICNRGCGGVAYLSVFDELGSTHEPAWVFPQGLGNDAKNVAEASSHEAGHNLGLQHDGTSQVGYYGGQGVWAPIMGVGYDRPLVQWSAGFYPDANNPQDDLAQIASYLPRQADEASGSPDSPSVLPTDSAVIGTRNDVDTYLLGSCTPGSSVDVLPAATSPDLDVRASLVDGDGTERVVSQPASTFDSRTTAGGLGASLTVPASGDHWVVTVDGTGEGSWSAGGYDDYGSLGRYTISAPGCDGQLVDGVPSQPRDVAATVGGETSLTLTWSEPETPGNGPVTGYRVTRSGSATAVTLPADARSHTFTGLTGGTTYQLSVRAVNATGAGPFVTTSGTTDPPVTTPPSAPRDVTGSYATSTGKISAYWSEPASTGTSPITGYVVYLDGAYLGQLAATSRGADITSATYFAEGDHTVGIAAVSAAGASPMAEVTVAVPHPAAPEAPRFVFGSWSRITGKIQVSWTTPATNGTTPITGYGIYLDGSYLGQLPATSRSAEISRPGGFSDGDYVVGVAAVNAVGSSTAAQVTVTVAHPVAPSAPRDVTGRYDWTTGYLHAVWNEPSSSGTSPITAYSIYLDNVYLGQVAGTARSVDITKPGGFADGQYVVGIAASSADGLSPMASVTITKAPEAPSAPTGVTASREDGAATVSWNAAAPNGSSVTGYTVTASPGGATATVSGGQTSARVTGLTNGTAYTFSVTATNRVGTSTASAATDPVVPAGVPARPDQPTATRGNQSAAVTWAKPSGNGSPVTGYTVTASPGGATKTVTGADTLSTTMTGLTNGTAYTFTVSATNAIGDSDPSAPSDPVTPAGPPAAPAKPSASRGDGSATVTWAKPSANGSPVTGYTVTAYPGGATKTIAGADTLSTTITGLTNGTAYTFTVSATNVIGDSAASSASDAVTPAGVPVAPDKPIATRGNQAATITWTKPSGNGAPVTAYTVTATPGGATKTVTGADTLSTTITGLTNGTAYTFTVVATNAVGDSDPSAPSDEVTPAGAPLPVAKPTAVRGDQQATVSWIKPSGNGSPVTGYTVTASPGGATKTVTGADTLSTTVTGLTNGTAYTFTVTATNAVGDSAASSASDAVTPAGVPATPAKPRAVRGNQAATITWTKPSGNGAPVTGYTVTALPGGATKTITDPDTTTTLISGLTNGTAYTFTVTASNVIGSSSSSDPSDPVTPAGVPDPPDQPAVVRGDHQATVSWEKPSGNSAPVTGYTVTASPGGATKTVTDPDTISTVMTGLTNGTAYTFTVVATNAVGDSLPSTASNPVTPAGVPATPTKPTAVRGNKQAVVSWTAPSANGSPITDYTVTASPGGKSITVSGDLTSATVTGLTNGTSYTFTVTATNEVGTSTASPPSAPVTPAGVPARVAKPTVTVQKGTVTVAWKAPAPNGAPITRYVLDLSRGADRTVSGSVTRATLRGLPRGSYRLQVIAVNAVGRATPSPAVTWRIR